MALFPAQDVPAAAPVYRPVQQACSYRAAPERVEPEAADSNSAVALPRAVSPGALPDAHSNFHRADSHHYQQASLAEPVALERLAALELASASSPLAVLQEPA